MTSLVTLLLYRALRFKAGTRLIGNSTGLTWQPIYTTELNRSKTKHTHTEAFQGKAHKDGSNQCQETVADVPIPVPTCFALQHHITL